MPFEPSRFRFVNYSGTYMLRLETAEDLAALPLLDEPFWLATSAPIHHLRCDARFLAFVDSDGDSRILSRDVRRVHAWMIERLGDLSDVTGASDVLDLTKLTDCPASEALATAARRILFNLDKPEAGKISLAEVRDHQAYRVKGFHNGDGVIAPEAVADNDELKTFITDVVATVGGSGELCGQLGASEENLDLFLKCARELLAWSAQAEEERDESVGLFPLGDATAVSYDRLNAMRAPLDRFFRLCRLASLNQMLARKTPVPESSATVEASIEEVDALLAQAPLASPSPDEVLNLDGEINPHYREPLRLLRDEVARPVLGDSWSGETLTAPEWEQLKQTFAVYEAWLQAKSGGEVEKLGPDKLKEYLDGPLPELLRGHIRTDQEVGKELAVVQDLENLVLTQRWFLELANNFISFHNLYDPEARALFEIGRLVISGRVFNLNMQVKDINAHSNLAKDSGILLLYSEVTSADKAETFFMVTPVTSMTLGRLGPERRGVLFDLQGREWDARVVKIVDNPISLWDAIRKPFIRIGTAIGGAFNKLVTGAEKQLEATINKSATDMESTVKSGMTAPPPGTAVAPAAPGAPDPAAAQRSSGGIGQWFLGGSMAIAALGSSFAFIASKLQDDKARLVALNALLIGLAIILLATVLSSWWRLRRRNLGSLLEASGWAINARMRVSWRLARVLAPKLVHPAGFMRVRRDLTGFFLRRMGHKPAAPGSADKQI